LSARVEGGECFLRIDALNGSRSRPEALSIPALPDLRRLGLWLGDWASHASQGITGASTLLFSAL